MNLLIDPWVPVHKDGKFCHITYKELLCGKSEWQVSLPRDDLEMACLQLLIALTQVLFTPEDMQVWLNRQEMPLSQAEFKRGVERYMKWFDLSDPEHPFMQTKGITANTITPIQKLFVGLPEGASAHVFFNPLGEIAVACASCTAIALFNNALNAPSFGGGFKYPISTDGTRVPLSTLILGQNLRETIWRNVLYENSLTNVMPGWRDVKDQPVWVSPIQPGSKEHAMSIGLIRGSFWQPAKVELLSPIEATRCDCCGLSSNQGYSGFKKQKFADYEIEGIWPRPLSPRQWKQVKGNTKESAVSFSITAPAWTQLTQFMLEKSGDEREGFSAAPVVNQFKQAAMHTRQRLFLLVGGYRNRQALVLERRHELFNLAAGWESHLDDICDFVADGLAIKDALRESLFRFSKQSNAGLYAKGRKSALADQGETSFYRQSEAVIHASLRDIEDTEDYAQIRGKLARDLCSLARDIFDQETAPYRHRPEIYRVIAQARAGLNAKLKTLQGGEHA